MWVGDALIAAPIEVGLRYEYNVVDSFCSPQRDAGDDDADDLAAQTSALQLYRLTLAPFVATRFSFLPFFLSFLHFLFFLSSMLSNSELLFHTRLIFLIAS